MRRERERETASVAGGERERESVVPAAVVVSAATTAHAKGKEREYAKEKTRNTKLSREKKILFLVGPRFVSVAPPLPPLPAGPSDSVDTASIDGAAWVSLGSYHARAAAFPKNSYTAGECGLFLDKFRLFLVSLSCFPSPPPPPPPSIGLGVDLSRFWGGRRGCLLREKRGGGT